jgi:peptidyl-prolyl cis-trans isomerase D
MLDFMRRNARSTAIKVVFGVIIAVFVLWGVGSFSDAEPTYAATVNDDAITPKELNAYARQLESFYRRMYGENYSPELERSLDLRNRALDQLINRVLLRQEALRLGLAVTDEEIREAIGKIEGLNADGRFRRDIYFRFVRSQGLSPGEFEEQMSDDLLVRKIQNLYTSSLPIDETTARALYTFSNEKANLSFVELLTTGYHKEVTVTAEEARAYYEKVKESFREPTRAAIEIVAYPNEHFAKAAIVTDEEVKTEYELHKDDRYTQPEEVQARHILFRLEPDADEATRKSVREKADATLARLKKGEDFAKVAKDVSEDEANKEQGGDLGKFPRGRMEESFETAAFALEKGALSDVVETRFGLHLIKVEDKTAQRQKEIDEVREEITERLRGEKSEGFARDAAFTDARAAKGGKTLEELAKAHGLKADTPPPFTETESVVGVPKLPALTKSAFATAHGEIGEAIEGPGVVYVFRVKEKVASHVPDFEKIQTRVETALRDNRAADKAREHAEKIRKQLVEGKTLAELAAAEKLEVEETGPFSRGGEYVPRIGGVVGLSRQAFELTPEKPVAPEVYTTNRAAYVAILKEKTPADLAAFDEKKDDHLRRYSEEQQKVAIESLLRNLKRTARIRVNPTAITAPA